MALRACTLVMCTFINGNGFTPCMASNKATDVWVNAPGVEHRANQLACRKALTGRIDLVDHRTFVVALETLGPNAQRFRVFCELCFHVNQRGRAVHTRLARAEQIEGGAIEQQDVQPIRKALI